MSTYFEDILSQPEELEEFLRHYESNELQNVLAQLDKSAYKKVIFSGMGSSHFCALTAGLLLRQRGIDAQVISAGELLYFELETLNEDVLLCLISQSGESGEIVRLIDELPGNVTVAGVTNHPESTLGRRSNFLLPLFVSDEASVTTRTYLSSCAATLLLAAALQGRPVGSEIAALKEVFAGMRAYLCRAVELCAGWEEFMRPMEYVCVIGRGFSMPSVEAGALFLREVLRFPALDFDGGEFRHGPMEMVDDNFYGIVMAPGGTAWELSRKLAKDIAEKGGHVLLITDSGENLSGPNLMPVILPEVPEQYRMFYEILPLQLLANAMTEYRGIEAGKFRWGSKVTKEE